MARLLSMIVGLPRGIAGQGRTMHTGIRKEPVRDRRLARWLHLDGDGEGDLAGRSGIDVSWDPASHSLLAPAEACDVPV